MSEQQENRPPGAEPPGDGGTDAPDPSAEVADSAAPGKAITLDQRGGATSDAGNGDPSPDVADEPAPDRQIEEADDRSDDQSRESSS